MRIISGKSKGWRTLRGPLVLVFVLAVVGGPGIAAAGPFGDPAPSPPPGDPAPGTLPSDHESPREDPAPDIADEAGDLVSETLSPSPSPTPEPTPSPTPSPEEGTAPEEGTDPGDEDEHPTSQGEAPAEDAPIPDPLPETILDPDAPAEPELSWVPPGKRSTTDLLGRFDELDLLENAARRILAPFPVFGPARYSDDWHAPRPGGRLHEGVDVFAPRGTPVIAAADGVLTQVRAHSPRGGKSVWLTEPDGTYYFYAHLEAFHPDVARGARVSHGDVLGYVGTTGNAQGTMPHLHFEIHPRGGEAVPPVRYLDRWLDEAREVVGFFVPLRATPVTSPDVEFEELVRPASPPTERTLPAKARITRVRADETNPARGGPLGPFIPLAVGALGFPFFLRRLANAGEIRRRTRARDGSRKVSARRRYP